MQSVVCDKLHNCNLPNESSHDLNWGGNKDVNTLAEYVYSQKIAQKKYSSSRLSSETKPSTKLVLESREPLLYLEFNKPNKQNVYEINSFNKFSFSQSQNNC